MCNVCGCNDGNVRLENSHHDHHDHESGHLHTHNHFHHHHDHDDDLHFGQGPAHNHVEGFSQTELVEIEQNILSKNTVYANNNRALLDEYCTLTLNLVSSPGSGKTTLLIKTIAALNGQLPVAVIEGDQETTNDAKRIRETGVSAIQINTGRGCHLDAHMVGHAIEKLPLEQGGVLFIENVGNLVCPASFDLGEHHKVALLSVTEGDDKPLKYPDMFAASELMILNKIDLLPYVTFDVERCTEFARRVNPDIKVLTLSAQTMDGMTGWLDWIFRAQSRVLGPRHDKVHEHAQSHSVPTIQAS